MAHNDCHREEDWGRVKTFIEGFNGLKTVLVSIVIAIITQVGTFLFLWGSLTTTVKNHELGINKIMDRIDKIQIVPYAKAGEK